MAPLSILWPWPSRVETVELAGGPDRQFRGFYTLFVFLLCWGLSLFAWTLVFTTRRFADSFIIENAGNTINLADLLAAQSISLDEDSLKFLSGSLAAIFWSWNWSFLLCWWLSSSWLACTCFDCFEGNNLDAGFGCLSHFLGWELVVLLNLLLVHAPRVLCLALFGAALVGAPATGYAWPPREPRLVALAPTTRISIQPIVPWLSRVGLLDLEMPGILLEGSALAGTSCLVPQLGWCCTLLAQNWQPPMILGSLLRLIQFVIIIVLLLVAIFCDRPLLHQDRGIIIVSIWRLAIIWL